MKEINVNNEKDISVNLTNKSSNLTLVCSILFIGLILCINLLLNVFYNIKLLVTIFSFILLGLLLLSILFSSFSNFLTYNYRDNKNKLYKNNKIRNVFLIVSYSLLWSFLILSLVFLMVLLILK